MKTYSVYLTIGHNVKERETFDSNEICDYVHHYLGVDAFTAIECRGMWQGKSEKSTRIEMCSLDRTEADRIVSLVQSLASALCQQSIMCEMRADNVQFIEARTFAAVNIA